MRTSYAFAAVGLAVLGLAGCELVLGLDDREVYEAPAVDAGPDVSTDAPSDATEEPDGPSLPPGCTLPTTGTASLRIGSFIASSSLTHVDFCLKPQDAQSWSGTKPLVENWGADCPKGLAYRDLTAQFKVEGGGYDVKVIAAGESCEGEGVAPVLSQVSIEKNKGNELLVFGDGSSNLIKRFQESRTSGSNAFKFRFLHAAVGAGPYDMGLANPSPTGDAGTDHGWLSRFFADVEYTTTAAPGDVPLVGVVDANGYVEPQLMSSWYLLGAVPTSQDVDAGATDMELLHNSFINTGGAYTVFLTGIEGRTDFPKQLWTCAETASTGIFASCGDGIPKDLVVDVFNTQLNGAFSTYESQRRQPILDSLSNLDSDVLCVTEIWSDADKKALAEAAKAKGFEYSYYAEHTWDTPIDDPTDKDGNVPAAPTTAPCANTTAEMNTVIDCLRDKCMGGNEDAKPDATFKDCIMQCAQGGLITLISGDLELRTCWSCIFTQYASYESSAWTRDQCANNPKARYVFRGNDGAMILSKHPFKGTPDAWVLPATEWRVSVLRAPIQKGGSDGPVVDTYCTVLTTPSTSCLTRPYTGQYGGDLSNPMECTKQWAAELELQSGKLVNYVKRRSDGTNARAIVAGDFYSGQGYTSGDIEVLKAQFPESYQKLIGAFAEAVPIGYTPECTLCPADNPIITPPGTPTTGNNTWTTKVMLWGYPITLVSEAHTILKDPVIDVGMTDADGGTILIPLSQYWGFRSKIRLYP